MKKTLIDKKQYLLQEKEKTEKGIKNAENILNNARVLLLRIDAQLALLNDIIETYDTPEEDTYKNEEIAQ